MPITPELKRVYASAPKSQRYVDTLALAHPAFPQTFYIANSWEQWTFDLGEGTLQSFERVAFQIVFPTSDGKGQQDLRLVIDNVGRVAMQALELAAAQPQAPIDVTVRTYLNVMNSLPQNSPLLTLTLTEIEVTRSTITGTATRADTLNRPFPSLLYRPDLFPGLDR